MAWSGAAGSASNSGCGPERAEAGWPILAERRSATREAILARDGAAAEALMRDHLRAERNMVLEAVLPTGLGA